MKIWKPPPLNLFRSITLISFIIFDCNWVTAVEQDELGVLEFLFGSKGIIPKLIRDPLPTPLSPITRPIHDTFVQWSHDAPAPFDAPILQSAIGNPENSDFFSKLFDKLRRKKYGGPVQKFDLPSIGLCTKATCGGLYTALERFQKSPVLNNFNTMMSLMQDKDGFQTIAEVITDKDIISTFTGAGARKPPSAPPPRVQPYQNQRIRGYNPVSPRRWTSSSASSSKTAAEAATSDYYDNEDSKPPSTANYYSSQDRKSLSSTPTETEPLDFESFDVDFGEAIDSKPITHLVQGPAFSEDQTTASPVILSRPSNRHKYPIAPPPPRHRPDNPPPRRPDPPPPHRPDHPPPHRPDPPPPPPHRPVPQPSYKASSPEPRTLRRPVPIRPLPIIRASVSKISSEIPEDVSQGITVHKPEPLERIPVLQDDVARNPFAEKHRSDQVIISESNDAPRRIVTLRERLNSRKAQIVQQTRPTSSVDISPVNQRQALRIQAPNLNRRRNLLLLNRRAVSSPKKLVSTQNLPPNNHSVQNNPNLHLVGHFRQPNPARTSLQERRPVPAPVVKPRSNEDYYNFYDD